MSAKDVLIDRIAEVVEAWMDCPHLSFDGTGVENEWRCMGCGRVHLEVPDEYGETYHGDGTRTTAEVVLDSTAEQCAVNIVGAAFDPSELVEVLIETGVLKLVGHGDVASTDLSVRLVSEPTPSSWPLYRRAKESP